LCVKLVIYQETVLYVAAGTDFWGVLFCLRRQRLFTFVKVPQVCISERWCGIFSRKGWRF